MKKKFLNVVNSFKQMQFYCQLVALIIIVYTSPKPDIQTVKMERFMIFACTAKVTIMMKLSTEEIATFTQISIH